MKVFFACALSSLKEEGASKYKKYLYELVSLLNNKVIISSALLHSPTHGVIKKDDFIDQYNAFEKNKNELCQSNHVIADVSYPSMGVGAEIGLAYSLEIPTTILLNTLICDDQNKISSFILRMPNIKTIVEYNYSSNKLDITNNILSSIFKNDH